MFINRKSILVLLPFLFILIMLSNRNTVYADFTDEIDWATEKELAEKERNTSIKELGYMPGEVLVCFEEGTSIDEIRSIIEKYGGQLSGLKDDGSIMTVDGKPVVIAIISDITVDTAIKLYNSEAKVYYAEKDYVASPGAVEESKTYHLTSEDEKLYICDQDGARLMNGTPEIDGIKYYVQNGELCTGWLYLDNYKMYFDPETFEGAKGFQEINGKMYLFNKDSVMQNFAGTTNISVNGEVNKYWFSDDDASLKTGWLALGSMKLYFDPDTYKAYTNGVYEIDGSRYLFNGDGVVLQNGTPVVNGEKYYCSSTGELKTGWLYLTNWKMYFDPETYAAGVGFREIGGKMYLFNSDGVMQNYAGTTLINLNGENKKYWFSTDDASLKTGWLTLGNMKLYFDPETYAAYTDGVYGIDGQKYLFNSDGVMTGVVGTVD